MYIDRIFVMAVLGRFKPCLYLKTGTVMKLENSSQTWLILYLTPPFRQPWSHPNSPGPKPYLCELQTSMWMLTTQKKMLYYPSHAISIFWSNSSFKAGPVEMSGANGWLAAKPPCFFFFFLLLQLQSMAFTLALGPQMASSPQSPAPIWKYLLSRYSCKFNVYRSGLISVRNLVQHMFFN